MMTEYSKDNPFVGQENAKEAYTYGNRNPQGLALNPFTGDIWEHEHGPKGGDEINIIKKPLITAGQL
jgi:glucose/arabinose dehydrogenase